MEASIIDLRKHMSKVIAALDMNETVTLTYRGKEKAKIVPLTKQTKTDIAQSEAFGLWADKADTENVETFVRDIRKGRNHAI